MKNLLRLPVIILSLSLLTASQCNKNPVIPEPEFYFTCKVDGQEYIPNGCTNCRVSRLLGDTTFLFNGNRGYESILIGIIKLDHLLISATTYVLDQRPEQKGSYKNSTTINDKFDTDSLHVGILQIISLDKEKKVISGTFSFRGYNPVQDKTINITEGKFRLKYTTN